MFDDTSNIHGEFFLIGPLSKHVVNYIQLVIYVIYQNYIAYSLFPFNCIYNYHSSYF